MLCEGLYGCNMLLDQVFISIPTRNEKYLHRSPYPCNTTMAELFQNQIALWNKILPYKVKRV